MGPRAPGHRRPAGADPAAALPRALPRRLQPEAKALAEAEGLDSWQALFEKHADASVGPDPERPSLWMWVAEASPDELERILDLAVERYRDTYELCS